MLKSTYEYKEASLGRDFCVEKTLAVKELIDSSTTFTMVAMPAVGVSYFMRYLATNPYGEGYDFVHINAYELHTLNKLNFYKLLYKELDGGTEIETEDELILAIKELTLKRAQCSHRLVIIFNRFDQLDKCFDEEFFGSLYMIREMDKERIVMIFTSTKPLIEIVPEMISGANLYMFSKSLYFGRFTDEELVAIYSLNNPGNLAANPSLKRALALAQGHHQLFQLLLNSVRLDDPLLDRFIKIRLAELYEFLSHNRQKMLEKVVNGKVVEEIDDYLIGIGMVMVVQGQPKVFSPLFGEYLKSHIPVRLPAKEKRLFRLLQRNIDRVVSKDEIFTAIWGENSDKASDWALNSLIYRLKRQPAYLNSGYILENQKKEGYILYRE